jgi:hypothetical protein
MSTQINTDQRLSSVEYSLHVQIGDICCAVRCYDTEALVTLRQLYSDFLSDKSADLTIELEVLDRLNPSEIAAVMPETVFTHEGNHFWTTSQILSGEHDLGAGIVRARMERGLLKPGADFNLLNRLLCLAYYSACKIRYNGKPPALLVHSCGILRRGHAILFTGPSEAGKTTIAGLCDNKHGQVLNDEMLLLSWPRRDNGTLNVWGVPIMGQFSKHLNAVAPVRCILLLKQSKRTEVRRLDRMEAYLRFMRQVIAPAYIGQRDRRAVYSLIAEFSDKVTEALPFYELEFALDKELLWQVVSELERTIGEGG